jgi:ribonuclease P/MRP protein subunit POP8
MALGKRTSTLANNPPTSISPQVFQPTKMAQADGDVSMSQSDAPQVNPKEQKINLKGHEIAAKTIKAPSFSYARLELISQSTPQTDLDELTVRTHITSALTQFLGLTGSAIPVDVLKVEGQVCWIRVPREDLSPVIAAVGGWTGSAEAGGKVGLRVRASGNWLSTLVGDLDAEKLWNE